MRKAVLLLYFAVVFVAVSCTPSGVEETSVITEAYVPCNGDLIFLTADESEFSDAIATATAQTDELQFVHVAVIAVDDGVASVIEATAKHGVSETPYFEYIKPLHRENRGVAAVIKRITEDIPMELSVQRVKECLGQGYNWTFMPTPGKKYCSELVYECFLRPDGSHIFTAKPMNFLDPNGNMPAFWTNIFSALGLDVPQGQPGTNPNDMSKEPCLREVYRYFTSTVSQIYTDAQ